MQGSLRRAVRAAGIGALALVMIGCDEQPTEQVERIRAIKPYYVAEPAGGDVRRYTGKIAASNTSALSFAEIAEVMGTPLGTALARAHRGLAKLRRLMESDS